jgi:hypothetical protein
MLAATLGELTIRPTTRCSILARCIRGRRVVPGNVRGDGLAAPLLPLPPRFERHRE